MSRRFAVLLMADVVDYSLMMGEDEDATISLVQHLRDSILEPSMKRFNGSVLKRMGDGWIFSFDSMESAINAAKSVQTELSEDNGIRLRMSLHMGDIVEDDTDFYGSGINLAARLLTEAPPGGVMVSDDLYKQLSDKKALEFKDAGTFNLKNITRPVQGFQWRPNALHALERPSEVPVIAIEVFTATPNNEEITEAAADLRDQIIHSLSSRTGIRVLDSTLENPISATYVLRGRLRFSSGIARVNLSLVIRSDGTSCWTERYESKSVDLYAFCDDVSAKADGDLRLFITSLDNIRIADLPDDQLSVSELRTRGAGLFYECTIPALKHCLSVMSRAKRLNPEDGMTQGMWATAVLEWKAYHFETFDDGTLGV